MYVTHQIKACPKKKEEEWYQPLFFNEMEHCHYFF